MHRGGARCVAFIQGLRIRSISTATTAAATAQALTICCKAMRRCVALCMDTAVVRQVRRSLRVPCCHGEPSARTIVASVHALVFVVVGSSCLVHSAGGDQTHAARPSCREGFARRIISSSSIISIISSSSSSVGRC